jgi:hypothetical protein
MHWLSMRRSFGLMPDEGSVSASIMVILLIRDFRGAHYGVMLIDT